MHGLPRQGVQQFRCYFTERLQDKAALRKARMGHYKVFFINYPVAVQQKIKIHTARSLVNRPDPFKGFILYLQQVGQQGTSVKPCRESEHRVVERILPYSADR